MKKFASTVAVVLCASIAEAGDEAALRHQLQLLRGTWRWASLEVNGGVFSEKELAETPTPFVVRFEQNRVTRVEPGKAPLWHPFTIRPGTTPKQLDLSDDNGELWLAIYSIDKDVLRIASGVQDFRLLAPEGSKPAIRRPKSFDAEKEAKGNVALVVVTLKRLQNELHKK